MSEVIQASDIKHSYDGSRFALKGVSFTVRKGEVFGLLGRNGAGKSTLIKILTTLIRPTAGELSVLGLRPEHQGAEIRSRIGVVQQADSYDYTTVEKNLDLYAVLWGVPRGVAAERREFLLRKFGLEDIRKKRMFDLSGGQQRRVQVAREFMHDMDILFLDEPTTGMDVVMRRDVLDFVKEQVKRGLSIVFTTHILEEADYICDRIAVIDEGKIIALDSVSRLKAFYGGKKTVEFTVAGDGKAFLQELERSITDDYSIHAAHEGPMQLVTSDPKAALQVLTSVAQRVGAQFDWLSVRSNTLEDVFLNSISKEAE
ncbi:MAG: ABC transporter ATP-binding protein [Thermoprotei archaeon]